MQIFNNLNKNPNLSVALGYFDGVHLGHQTVIKSAVDYAKENGNKSAVITFKDHPCCYIRGICPKYILSRETREEKIEQLGIDYLYELDFNEDIYSLTALEYLENIIINYFKPNSITTGFNHNFGAHKSGNAKVLKDNQNKYGYKYFEIPPQKINNEIISSTKIRNYLTNGDIQVANKMLGNNFSIQGKVIEGQKLGRQLGFRTANLSYPKEIIEIPKGVYEVRTNYGKGITNYGIRPTINNHNKETVAETHIIDFNKNIYGETLKIEFIRMLREERNFNSTEELKKQINSDISSIL